MVPQIVLYAVNSFADLSNVLAKLAETGTASVCIN